VDVQTIQRRIIVELPLQVPITKDSFEFFESIADTAKDLPSQVRIACPDVGVSRQKDFFGDIVLPPNSHDAVDVRTIRG